MPGKHDAKSVAARQQDGDANAWKTNGATYPASSQDFTSGRAPNGYVFPEPISPDDFARSRTSAPASAAASTPAPSPEPAPAPSPATSAAFADVQSVRKRKGKKRAIIAAICAIVALAAVIAVVFFLNPFGKPAEKAAAPETATVERGTLTATVKATGSLNPLAQILVNPEVSGTVEQVDVREGQRVKQGDTLFTIKNSDLDKALSDAESALEKAKTKESDAQSKLAEEQQKYDDAIDEYNNAVDELNNSTERAEEAGQRAYDKAYDAAVDAIPSSATDAERERLIDRAQRSAQDAYDEAYEKEKAKADDPGTFDHEPYVSAVEAAQKDVDSATKDLEEAQRTYDRAKEETDKKTVTSPDTGTVLSLTAKPGATVSSSSENSSSEPLAKIADLSKLTIEVQIDELQVSAVKLGMRATATFPAVEGLESEARVVAIDTAASDAQESSSASAASSSSDSSAASKSSVTYKVTVLIDKPDQRLKPGMSTDVKIVTKDIPNAYLVPTGAVMGKDDDAYVFVVTDKETYATEKRSVEVLGRSDEQVAIREGLSAGEVVLVGAAGNTNA